ncbi:thiamine-phosphate diphosphorylase [Solemya pervernicosa gill symbiont]|uniref:Thiamine-phosphate synthase n=2 Tax=Gammaproteobacteria incertae sedis TaxID=118884 RepID=A0A1T2L574_9GAMM|nr:thiamine phosphate synthase [Candidatus Reidiella endopervernicosa]OOZ40268.1 thiamine-phosphate diphosphorylase [Solemya pervernicosa gill symbiont]QKQ26034.1 thiamine phosphate synthase [Candidatus Reidiella endopervernicosa]
MSAALHGLYAITDRSLTPDDQLIPAVAAAIQGGAKIIQYRDKSDDAQRRQWEAQDLLNLCRALNTPLLINDNIELAAAIGADGVHLGQQDGELQSARTLLGDDAIIGITCHDNVDLAIAAERGGANYVAFGRFFSSKIKPEAPPADPALLTTAREQLTVPIVAIGGITPENGAQLISAGADMVAVINGVFGEADISAAAQRFATLFK